MTDTPKQDDEGDVEEILKYLVDNVELIRHRVELRHLKPAEGFNHNERLKAEALAALKAREQRIAIESRIDEMHIAADAHRLAGGKGLPKGFQRRMNYLTAQLEQGKGEL